MRTIPLRLLADGCLHPRIRTADRVTREERQGTAFTTTARFIGVVCAGWVGIGCTETGPLDDDDLRALPGQLFYSVGGQDHHDVARPYRQRFADPSDEPVTDGAAPAFVYGAEPQGSRIVMTVNDDVVLARPDGEGAEVVASSPEIDWYPRFSPDGRFLVFESARSSFRDLYRLEVTTGELVRLTDDPEGNFDAAWSPDGRRLAFASSRAGQLDVWVMNADGSAPRRLTRHAGDSIKPRWSPSGRYIAFISARDGKDDLYVVTPDGSRVTKLSPDAPKKGRPWSAPHVSRFEWHPREDRIVYAARPPRGAGQIHVVDVPSGRSRRLSSPEHDDREPTWSPDGAHVAFASHVEGGSEIFVMRAEGDRRTRLTDTRGRAWLPRWFEAANSKGSDS